MSNYIIANGELYHAGVKGMRWGVRRWQNEDGSLTPAGKARYQGEADKVSAKARAKVDKIKTDAENKAIVDRAKAMAKAEKIASKNERALERKELVAVKKV